MVFKWWKTWNHWITVTCALFSCIMYDSWDRYPCVFFHYKVVDTIRSSFQQYCTGKFECWSNQRRKEYCDIFRPGFGSELSIGTLLGTIENQLILFNQIQLILSTYHEIDFCNEQRKVFCWMLNKQEIEIGNMKNEKQWVYAKFHRKYYFAFQRTLFHSCTICFTLSVTQTTTF